MAKQVLSLLLSQYKSTNTDKLREQHVDMLQQPGVVEKVLSFALSTN
jgi:hypothetical protein